MICRSKVIFFYCNKNKKMEVVKENVNSRLLVSTLNKTNKNELIVVRTNYSIVEPIVFRKVNTLMEVRNMNEDFLAAAIVAEKSLQRLQEIIDSMVDEELEPIEE